MEWRTTRARRRHTRGGRKQETLKSLFASNHYLAAFISDTRLLVFIRRTQEHRPEVSNEIDDEENGALLGPHGEVATLSVAINRVSLGSADKEVVDPSWGSGDMVRRVGSECEREKDDNDHHGVHVVGEESSFDTAKEGIQDDTDWKKETSGRGWHASQRSYNRRATCEKHCRDENVGHEREGNVDKMGGDSIASLDDLQKGVCIWGLAFELDGEGCEEDYLHSRS